MKPYIGICDFTSAEQIRSLLPLIPDEIPRQLMVGVMMSRKTLRGIKTRWSGIFPRKEDIKDIFVKDERALNTIHYADYSVGKDVDPELANTLAEVVYYGGQNLDAIQLDMIWPDPNELAMFRRSCDVPIVLQVGLNAMRDCGDDTIMTRDRLGEYGDSIDAVLFDKSMGRGLGMDSSILAQFVGVLVADLPHLLPAVAGGLGPSSIHLVEWLVSAYPQVSIDAQSRLRTSGDMKDPINWNMARDYLRQAMAMYGKKH